MVQKSQSKKELIVCYCVDTMSETKRKQLETKISGELLSFGYKKTKVSVVNMKENKQVQNIIHGADLCIIDARQDSSIAGYCALYATQCSKSVLMLIAPHMSEIGAFYSEKMYPYIMVHIQDTAHISKETLNSFINSTINEQKHRYTLFLEKSLYTILQNEAEKRSLSLTATLETLMFQWVEKKKRD